LWLCFGRCAKGRAGKAAKQCFSQVSKVFKARCRKADGLVVAVGGWVKGGVEGFDWVLRACEGECPS